MSGYMLSGWLFVLVLTTTIIAILLGGRDER